MSIFLRATASILAAVLAVGPVSVATASAANATIVAQTGQTGVVKGTVTDTGGAPLQGATITASGPTNTSTTTGSDGSFTLTLQPGIYQFAAVKTGYEPATQTDFVVVAGTTSPLSVSLAPVTLTSLREIGRVSVSRGRSTFNASPASIATVSNAVFSDQGQLQVQRVLDQTPGIVIEHPGTSANNSTPGNITFPAIRGGLGFETSSLLDGHPLAVQTFGDYVTTFLNADVLSGAEVIKGPGAAAPEINYAINGTVNFRTLDPTSRPTGQIKYGMDSYGGQFSNFRYANTFGGKLGIVLDYAVNGSPGPLGNSGTSIPVTVTNSWYINCPSFTSAGPAASCQSINGFTSTNFAAPGVVNIPRNAATVVACCATFGSTFDNKTELVKLRYNVSPTTHATVSYLGSQTWVDQNGNTSIGLPTFLCPGQNMSATLASPAVCSAANGYSGTYLPGQTLTTAQSVFFPPEFEVNNEPIFQGEVSTSIGRDTLIARYYTASINRTLQDSFSNPLSPFTMTMTLNGVLNLCPAGQYVLGSGANSGKCAVTSAGPFTAAAPTAFNNVPVSVTQTGDYFEQTEEDKLHGATFEYDHYLGDSGNVISLSFDQVNANTDSYQVFGQAPALLNSAAGTFAANSGATVFPSFSIWGGSAIKYTTVLLRGIFNIGPQWNLTLSNYFDGYSQTYTSNGGTTAATIANTTFQTATSSRYDPRIGLTFRPTSDLSVRLGAGSGVSPPYLSLLDNSAANTIPVLDTSVTGCNSTCAKNTVKTGTLKPETSFGYNAGFDARVSPDGLTVLSMDAYMNNLKNQFITSATFGNGTVTVCQGGTNTNGVVGGPAPCASGTPITVPLFTSGSLNLDTARYMGLEFRISRDPALGFGGAIQGALIRAYPYNINPCIYSTTLTSTGAQNCTVFNTNLGVISGANYFASGPSGAGSGFNVVSNHGIPYSQGYAEIHWRYPRGGFLAFREQYYGPNNSLNLPAFFVAGASASFPINDSSLKGQVSADNLFKAYPNNLGVQFGGVGIPLVNNQLGLTNANVIGPTVWRFSLTKSFGDR